MESIKQYYTTLSHCTFHSVTSKLQKWDWIKNKLISWNKNNIRIMAEIIWKMTLLYIINGKGKPGCGGSSSQWRFVWIGKTGRTVRGCLKTRLTVACCREGSSQVSAAVRCTTPPPQHTTPSYTTNYHEKRSKLNKRRRKNTELFFDKNVWKYLFVEWKRYYFCQLWAWQGQWWGKTMIRGGSNTVVYTSLFLPAAPHCREIEMFLTDSIWFKAILFFPIHQVKLFKTPKRKTEFLESCTMYIYKASQWFFKTLSLRINTTWIFAKCSN